MRRRRIHWWIRLQPQAAGFSLIEVLVALVILGVGLMGLARLQLYLLAGTADTAAYDLAVRLASAQIETLRLTRMSGSVPTAGADEQALPGIAFQRSWAVTCGVDQLCQSEVTVKWAEPRGGGQGGQRELVLTGHLAPPSAAEQGWLVQSGPPNRETLP